MHDDRHLTSSREMSKNRSTGYDSNYKHDKRQRA